MPSVAPTPRKRTALPPNQHQITNFFSPAPAPKLAPEIPGDLQAQLISVGMRARSSFALAEYRNAPTLASSSLAAETPVPVAAPMTPKKFKPEHTYTTPTWTPVNKRTRDNFEDVEMEEAAVKQDLETPAQREQARLDMASMKKKPLAPKTNVQQKQATLRKGGFWKAVKRTEPVYTKGKVVKDVEMGDAPKTDNVMVDDFEEAGFLMDCA